jgi:4-cresol dehydrogenase (hydroxylating)
MVDDSQFVRLIEVLRTLALQGSLQPTFGVWNDYKLLAATRQYPWEAAGGKTPLPDDVRSQLTRKYGRWIVSAALFSSSARQAAADREVVRRALAPVTKRILFVDRRRARVATFLSAPIQRLTGFDLVKWVETTYAKSAFLGVPSTLPIRQAYWRKRLPIPDKLDPDRDRCGIMCCAPALPFEGDHARQVVRCIEETSLAYGLEPNITVLCVSPRNVDIAAFLAYDRDVEGDDARTRACHDELMSKLADRGYLPYRLGIHSMGLLPRPSDDSVSLLRTLKRAIDPNDVLAPGRYDLRRFWTGSGGA